MYRLTENVIETNNIKPVIVPHAKCDSCGDNSGPTFFSTTIEGLSDILSNHFMSDLNRQSTLAHITQTEEKILEVDQEIYLLQQIVASLQNGKAQLELFKARKESLLAPIRKLPDDVLRYLFVMCQWHLSEDDGYIETIKSDTFVRRITQISSHWRSVAISCPELWSRIYVDCHEDDRAATDMIESFLPKCLSLSKEVPLSISFSYRAIPWMKRYDNICLEAIAKCAHRWKAFEFGQDCLFPELSVFIPAGASLPKLESLIMNRLSHPVSLNPSPALKFLCVDRDYCADNPDMTVSFQSAPSLTNLIIRKTNNIQKMFIDMPWEQIIHFGCWENDFKEEEFFDLFNAMPNLTSLEIRGRAFNCNRNVILPSLQLLSIKEYWMDEVGPNHILDFITTPQLRSFVMPCSYFSVSSVTKFLRRSGCSITDLTLTNAHLDEDSSWMESKQLQNLKKLCLRETTRFEWLTRLIVQDTAHGIFMNILFPELETLEVPDVQTVDLAGLIAMLKFRLQHIQQHAADIEGGHNVCYLKSVTVKISGYLSRGEGKERGILWVCAKIFFLQASFVTQGWVLTDKLTESRETLWDI
ncbi:hypothetical protein BDQ17DRAFT_483875 [Cyathus striatus]|nr:hypothetical protein BDQ17DRAFT_483875 [Cyathus striatus]